MEIGVSSTTTSRTKGAVRPDIFNYLNYRDYLKDYYLHRKSIQPSYSYAVFSLRAGIKSPNYLKLVMEGARGVTNENIFRFAKALGLNELETIFWENLVTFNQAKLTDQRAYYFVKLTHSPLPESSEGSPRPLIREIRDEWDYYSAWYHAAIRELVLLPLFREDPIWIARALKGRITNLQAKESLELLLRLKFLVRDDQGKLVQAEREVRYFNKQDLKNLAVQRFHKSTAEIGLDSIEKDPPSDRDFSGLTIAVVREALPELKAKLTEFRKLLNHEFSKLESGDQVLQINFQVIPLTSLTEGDVR